MKKIANQSKERAKDRERRKARKRQKTEKDERQEKGKGQGKARDSRMGGFNPHENILLKTDALKSTRGLSL